MAQYLEFISNHPYLIGAFALVAGLLVYNLVAGADKSAIDPSAATILINRDDAVVLDVRPMADYAAGHIIHSINVPVNSLKGQLGRLEKYKKRPLIVACRSGAQSALACRQLRAAGFEQVHNLKGGILAWQNANLPVSKKK